VLIPSAHLVASLMELELFQYDELLEA